MRAGVLLLLAWPALGQVLKIDDLTTEALRRNPEILAAQKALEAARQRPAQVRALPDPMLSAGYSSSGGPLPGQGLGVEPTSSIGFMLSQQLPAPGKRDLRAGIANREAGAAQRQYEQVQLNVVARVKSAYHRLHHTWAMTNLLERNRTLLERILKLTEARYALGKAAQADLLKAQTQLTLLTAKQTRNAQERRSREAEINILLARSPETPLPPTPDVGAREVAITLERLYAAARSSSPLLGRDQKMIERAELALNLAHKDASPDITVSAGYYNMGRMPDMYQARVDIPLALFRRSRTDAMVTEQANTLASARKSYEATDQSLLFRIKDDYLISDASWRLLRIYSTTLIPQAALTLQSSMSAYETGQVDFLTLLNNMLAVLEYEAGYHEEQMSYHLALIRIEEATGLKLLEE